MRRIRVAELLAVAALLAALAPAGAVAETPGKDGPISVSTSGAVLNEYARVPTALAAGATSIPVTDLATALPSLAAGDLVMLYQAQGAGISTAASAGYGAVLNYNGAGRYEFQTVASVSGSTIVLETYGSNCAGLTYSYDAGKVQVIRVPQASTLSVAAGASIRARNWDGRTGGVVALHVRDTLTVNGDISTNAQGFRGGAVDNSSSTPSITGPSMYASTDAGDGAEKGESIAGYQADYTTGRYGRGAPANGGGGGNGHNAGGGGGSNGNNGVTWNGQGNPDRSVASWDQAWNIDGSLTATTQSSGGGRGGYSYARAGDALTQAPGSSSWGNDFRREVGGLGGRPLAFDASGRVFLGGGGGAGDGNNGAAGAGGRGGGLVFVVAGTVGGTGRITANGQAGRSTRNGHNDAPGGGGGGGTVVVSADALSGVRVFARGGRGGNQLITNDENEGPGGGGGGGVVALAGGAAGGTAATGGGNGLTNSSSMTEFPPNGATRGGSGQPNEAAPVGAALPLCRIPPGRLEATKAVSAWDPSGQGAFNLPGGDVVYTFTVENVGYQPIDAESISLEDALPGEIAFWGGEFDPQSAPATGPVAFRDTSGTSGLSCCTGAGEVAFSSTPGQPPSYTYTPLQGPDPAVSHVRIQPSGIMAPRTAVELRFRARIR